MWTLRSVSLKTTVVDIIPNKRRADDAHSGSIDAESKGSENGKRSRRDSPLESFPPMEAEIVVIRNAMQAVADWSIANCLASHNASPNLILPITKAAQKPSANPL